MMKRFLNQHYSPVMFVLFIGLLTVAFVGLSMLFGAQYLTENTAWVNHERLTTAEHLFDSIEEEPPAYAQSRVLGAATTEDPASPVTDSSTTEEQKEVTRPLADAPQPSAETSVSPAALKEDNTPANLITAYFTIHMPNDLETFSVDLAENGTVFDAMVIAKEKGLLAYTTRTFASLGEFVTSINNVESGDGVWVYDINGQLASKGISFQKIQHADRITWRYDE